MTSKNANLDVEIICDETTILLSKDTEIELSKTQRKSKRCLLLTLLLVCGLTTLFVWTILKFHVTTQSLIKSTNLNSDYTGIDNENEKWDDNYRDHDQDEDQENINHNTQTTGGDSGTAATQIGKFFSLSIFK